MSVIAKLSRWYYRVFGRCELRPYERVCIDAWKTTLGEAGARLVDAQLTVCDLVQRAPRGRLVCLYRVRESAEARIDAHRFPLRAESALAAIVTLRARETPRRTARVTITLVRGVLFSLEFDQSPDALRWRHLPETSLEAVRVDRIADPMRSEGREGAAAPPPAPWLAELVARWGARDVRAPLEPPERERRVAALRIWLPEDYVALATECDGLMLGPLRIRGLAELDTIPLGDAGIVVIVEGKEGARYGASAAGSPGVYRISPDDDEPKLAGLTLQSILEAELGA